MAFYSLNGRVVVITGSTGGLGQAIAKIFITKGAKLALLDLDFEAVQKQAASLGGKDTVNAWQVDVCSTESVELAISSVAKHFGGIDIIIANAGITAFESLEHATPNQFNRVIDVNLNGVWRTFKAGLPYVKNRQGYLLAMSSLAAFFHSPLQAAYCASKAGVWAMCDSIRMELKHHNVGVGSVHPTFFHTSIMDQTFQDPAGAKLWNGNKTGLWKMVSIDEVIEAIVLAVEQRQEFIVIPKQNSLAARAPGYFRPIIEWLGFRKIDLAEIVNLSAQRK